MDGHGSTGGFAPPRAEPDRLAVRADVDLSDEGAAVQMTIDSSY